MTAHGRRPSTPWTQAFASPPSKGALRSHGAWEQGDFLTGATVTRTGVARIGARTNRLVEYTVVNGRAILEGDIDLGPVARVATTMADVVRLDDVQNAAVVVDLSQKWVGGHVPVDLPQPGSVLDGLVSPAIDHFHSMTHLRFEPRSARDADYVAFESAEFCSSPVGRVGGRQVVSLASAATLGNTIHELAHVAGLWHEQSRNDRDSFVRINWTKIMAGYEHNFRQLRDQGVDSGPYDYASIMHYPATAFSADGTATIEPLSPGVSIGQRAGLSAGDIRAINEMYASPAQTPSPLSTSIPDEGTLFTVDLGDMEEVTVASGGWRDDWCVHWEVAPLDGPYEQPLVTWTVSVGRSGPGLLTYFFVIQNLSSGARRVRGRYRVLRGTP